MPEQRLPAVVKGSRGSPFVGIPDPGNPELVADSDIEGLIGRNFTSAWFCIDPVARRRFDESTFLPAIYPHLSVESVVEGSYLVSLLDPIIAGLFRRAAGHDDVLLYGMERVRFVSAVTAQTVLRVRCCVSQVTQRASGRLLTCDTVLEADGRERPAMRATWLILFPDEPVSPDRASRVPDQVRRSAARGSRHRETGGSSR